VLGASARSATIWESIVHRDRHDIAGEVSIKDGRRPARSRCSPAAAKARGGLKPFTIRVGLRATAEGWTITTGAKGTALASGHLNLMNATSAFSTNLLDPHRGTHTMLFTSHEAPSDGERPPIKLGTRTVAARSAGCLLHGEYRGH